jgi:hypothetical protein
MKRYLLGVISFLLLFTSISYAQGENKDVTITASGSGKTLDVAKQTALRSAIEQAFGTFISAKTEIFNDELVADQIASVSSGNIKSFEMLNESQLPDGSWGVTLKAIVSVDKLTSFVQAKGVVVEIKGGLFALNIKQQMLNEEGEVKAIADMVGLLHEPMQTAFDYEIQTKDPVSLDAENKKFRIDYKVTAKTNANMAFCSDYFTKTLRAVSLSPSEVENYKSLNKKVFPIKVTYYDTANGSGRWKDKKEFFYLRKLNSIRAINALLGSVDFCTRLFTVQTGLKNRNGDEIEKIPFHISVFYSAGQFQYMGFLKYKIDNWRGDIVLYKAGVNYSSFVSADYLTLAEIEQLTKYSVRPRGVVSQFKHGGYVVNEENGKGLICSIIDVAVKREYGGSGTGMEASGAILIDGANKPTLSLNGYDDWEVPSSDDLELIDKNLRKKGIGNIENYFPIIEGNNPQKGEYSRLVRRFGNSSEVNSNTLAKGTVNETPADSLAKIPASEPNKIITNEGGASDKADTRVKDPVNSTPDGLAKTISTGNDSIIYISSKKCKLVIRNKKEKSFEYTLYNECQTGSCSGLENFEGEASTTDTGEPPYSMFEDPGAIKFTILEDGKVIDAVPEYSFVGRDCAFSDDYESKFELQIR